MHVLFRLNIIFQIHFSYTLHFTCLASDQCWLSKNNNYKNNNYMKSVANLFLSDINHDPLSMTFHWNTCIIMYCTVYTILPHIIYIKNLSGTEYMWCYLVSWLNERMFFKQISRDNEIIIKAALIGLTTTSTWPSSVIWSFAYEIIVSVQILFSGVYQVSIANCYSKNIMAALKLKPCKN